MASIYFGDLLMVISDPLLSSETMKVLVSRLLIMNQEILVGGVNIELYRQAKDWRISTENQVRLR